MLNIEAPIRGILTLYPWYFEPLSMAYKTYYQWYFETLPMCFWPTYLWYLKPSIYGILDPLSMVN
jgi:hypothetical protein